MANSQTIRAEVNRRVQLSNKVILTVLSNFIKSHNEHCGCEYCLLLPQYVNTKIDYQRAKRNNERAWNTGWYKGQRDETTLRYLVQRLKKEKDAIKVSLIQQINK